MIPHVVIAHGQFLAEVHVSDGYGCESSLPNTRRSLSSERSTSSHIHSLSPDCSLTTSILTWSPFLYIPISVLRPRNAVDTGLRDCEAASSSGCSGNPDL